MRSVIAITLFLACAGWVRSVTLSEKDALFWALETNKSVTVTRMSLKSDSLGLEKTKAGWLPQVGLDGSVDYAPLAQSGTGGVAGTNTPAFDEDLDISVSQALPGGGSITGSAGQGISRDLDSSTTTHNTAYGISVTQPLLKDGWAFGSQDYTMKVATLSSREFSLSQKKSLISTLSGIRTRFWTCYEMTRLTGIARDRLEYARQRLDAEKSRLALGQAAALDTLSTALSWLQARRDVLTAESGQRAAERSLGEALMLAGEGVELSGDTEPVIGELPAEEQFLEMVRTFDPDLKVFDLAAERLVLTEKQKRNALLPDLDLSAGYTHTRSGSDLFSDNTASSDNAVISLVLGYSLPTRSARIDVTRARLDAEENAIDKKQYELELKNQVTELRESWEEERLKLEIMTASRRIAEKQLDAARQGYELGTVDRLELLQAENDYTETAVSLLQAQVTLKKLEIVFDEITGRILTRFGVTL